MIAAGENPVVYGWELARGIEVPAGTFSGHHQAITSLAFSSDGSRIVSASSDGQVIVWETKTKKELGSFSISPLGITPTEKNTLEANGSLEVTSLQLAEKNTVVLAATADGILHRWNLLNLNHQKRSFRVADEQVVMILGPNNFIFSGRENEIMVYDHVTGQQLYAIHHPFGGVNHIAFSKDGAQFCVASGGRPDSDLSELSLWETKTGRSIRTFSQKQNPFLLSAFCPNNQYVLSADLIHQPVSGIIRLWETSTGKQLTQVQADSQEVRACVILNNGTHIVTAGVDGIVRLWTVQIPG
ncbi:MAG TPA: hypothetical protein PKE58_12045 [Acidobacteriota bacterium]|nr:hypothetical protein [Acidobacteriota bacterium]